jgi:hypothetical protein
VHKDIDVAEFCMNETNQSSPEEPGPGKMHREFAQIINGVSTMIFSSLSEGYQIANLANGWNKAPFEDKAGWDAPSAAGYTFNELMTGSLNKLGPVFLGVGPLIDTPGGRLDLFSTSSASVVGMSTAKLYGLWFTTIGSLGVVSVSAGGALSLSSNASATFGAPKVGINATFALSIESQLGNVTQRSRGNMELSSQAKMLIASEKDMQLTAMQGAATVYASKGALLAAGGGSQTSPNSRYTDVLFAPAEGFGAHATKDDLFLGLLCPVNEQFPKPARKTEQPVAIILQKTRIDVSMGDKTKMELTSDRIEVETDTYEVKARKEVKITAKERVLLG